MFCSICTFVLVFVFMGINQEFEIAKTWPCLFKSWGEGRMCHRLDQTSFALKGYWRWKLTVRKQKKNANVNHSIFSFNYTIKYFNFFFLIETCCTSSVDHSTYYSFIIICSVLFFWYLLNVLSSLIIISDYFLCSLLDGEWSQRSGHIWSSIRVIQ